MAYFKYDGSAAAESPRPTTELTGGGSGSVDTITGTAGPDQLYGNPADLMIGGEGGDTYNVYTLKDRVLEQPNSGVDTIIGWRTIDLKNFPNVENLVVKVGLAVGNDLDNVISGSDGGQQLYGGRGQDVLIGGGGPDVFIVYKGEGNDVIQDFAPLNSDVVRLKAGLTSFDQVKARLSQVGSDVKLDLGGGDGLIFRNLRVDQLSATNFQLEFDRSGLGPQTFNEDFNSLSLWDAESNPGGIWRPDFGRGNQNVFNYNQNDELQIYTSPYYREAAGDFPINPFSIDNGILNIAARESNRSDLFGKTVTSGMLTTAPSFSQQYGYFEIRADMPEGLGNWAAFWLLPTDNTWPPELDIMEGWEPLTDNTLSVYHTKENGVQRFEAISQIVPRTPDGFHTYGALWTPSTVTWFVDGVEVFRTNTPADMNKSMYMIVNLALKHKDGPEATVPADLKVDYIKAWALPQGYVETRAASYTMGPDDITLKLTSATAQTGVGNAKNNDMYSNDAASTLRGEGGADTLVAGRAGDTLSGGEGHDTFSFRQLPWGTATITDFQVGTDRIDLAYLYRQIGYTGTDPLADGYLVLRSNGSGGTYVEFDPDGPGQSVGGYRLANLLNVSPSTAATTLTNPAGAPGQNMKASGPNAVLMGGTGSDTVTASTGSNYLRGMEGDDVIQGGTGFDDAHGNMGNDTVRGGYGDDWVVGGKDNDNLFGDDGFDVVYGNLGNDTVQGGEGADWARGGQGDDWVWGDGANDFISGDRGTDTVIGGTGADTFNFFAGAGMDRILDFNGTEGDRIRFEGRGSFTTRVENGDTVIDFGGGDLVVLNKVTDFRGEWIFQTG